MPALPERSKSRSQKGLTEPTPAEAGSDGEIEHPAQMALSERERGTGDRPVSDCEPPELRVVVAAARSPLQPSVELLGRELPVLGERFLVDGMQFLVVLSRPVPADLEAGGRVGLRRLGFQGDFQAPEVPDDLVPTILDEAATVAGDDVDVEALEVAFAGPGLARSRRCQPIPRPRASGWIADSSSRFARSRSRRART